MRVLYFACSSAIVFSLAIFSAASCFALVAASSARFAYTINITYINIKINLIIIYLLV